MKPPKALIERVKKALRLSNTSFDDEVRGLIRAAYADMAMSGVELVDSPLIEHAVILYCKAHFGYGQDTERFVKAYDALKISLALTAGR